MENMTEEMKGLGQFKNNKRYCLLLGTWLYSKREYYDSKDVCGGFSVSSRQ